MPLHEHGDIFLPGELIATFEGGTLWKLPLVSATTEFLAHWGPVRQLFRYDHYAYAWPSHYPVEHYVMDRFKEFVRECAHRARDIARLERPEPALAPFHSKSIAELLTQAAPVTEILCTKASRLGTREEFLETQKPQPPAVVTPTPDPQFSTSEAFDNRYPHKCPACDCPAYIGLAKVECSNTCCENHPK